MVTLSGREGTVSLDDMAPSSSASHSNERVKLLGDVSRDIFGEVVSDALRCDFRPTMALLHEANRALL